MVSNHRKHRFFVSCSLLLTCLLAMPTVVSADERDQAKRIFDRIAGVPPDDATLTAMEDEIRDNSDPLAAAIIATNAPEFYNVTLKNFAAPWTNRAGDVFVDLNDYTATVIGIVRDDVDFRQMLFGDILYVGDSALGLPAYSMTNNAHYEALEDQAVNLRDDLVATTQSGTTSLPASATAGVLTSRAAAKSFFIDGTNRAMFRFTMLNHMCHDMEQVHDITRVPDRIRQDVSRSPGGDSRVFLNNCIGCHTGMDPMAQAFAYYDYARDEAADPEGLNGQITYNDVGDINPDTGTRVVSKYFNNDTTFEFGFITLDDDWANYWRNGPNKLHGWDQALPGSGSGAKTMGQELAHSTTFAQCQVEKVFMNVCLREPADTGDRAQVDSMVTSFAANNYSLRQVFAESAVYCMGD